MEAYAIHKGAMIAPRKARMTLDLIRGKDVYTAQGILENTNTKASRLILKVLNSAIANASFLVNSVLFISVLHAVGQTYRYKHRIWLVDRLNRGLGTSVRKTSKNACTVHRK